MKFSTVPKWVRFGAIAIFTAMAIVGLGATLNVWLASAPSTDSSTVASLPAVKLVSPAPLVPPPASPFGKTAAPSPVPAIVPSPVSKYGHLPYQEADANRLEEAGRFVRGNYSRPESLDLEAAQAFDQMKLAAKAQGVNLMPISGFRSISDQKLLFARQIERQGSESAAARLSAPPGYSEHHTGYAIDLADAQQPDTDLKLSFAETTAYRWLMINAAQFGFEQSFPFQNAQGVSFEPWHWRYAGTARAAKIFAIAHKLFSPSISSQSSSQVP